MDIITLAMLAFFGSLLVGGLVGSVVGKFTGFELGLGIGLLIPGFVALSFCVRCLLDYREFTSPQANRAIGKVIAIEDKAVNASGSVTQPVPIVRFNIGDSVVHFRGPGASGLKVGENVDVLYDPIDPRRTRVANPSQLRGVAIALMLFGTFPLSLGLWFIHSYAAQQRERRMQKSSARKIESEAASPTLAQRMRRELLVGFNLLLFAGVLYVGFGPGELERNFAVGFGLVTAALFGHGVRGAFDPNVNASWCFGMIVLAVNFGAWAAAMWLLF